MEWRSNSKHSSYKSIDKSSIVLGAPTTLLREAYYFNKSFVLDSARAANIKGYPFKGENYLKDFNYIDFEKRLNNLFKSSFKEYLSKLGKPKNFFMGDINTVALIKNLIKKELKEKKCLIKNQYLLLGNWKLRKEWVRHLLKKYKKIKRLVIFSRDELKQFEMEQEFSVKKYPCMRYFIGDIRDRERLTMALRDIDYVIRCCP